MTDTTAEMPKNYLIGKTSVEVITTPNSDLKVVNSARVSMAKMKTEIDSKDEGLIRYLASHAHWTTFAHCRDTFGFWATYEQFGKLVMFLNRDAMTGMVYKKTGSYIFIRHSLWGWATMFKLIAEKGFTEFDMAGLATVLQALKKKYPISGNYVFSEKVESFFTIPKAPIVNVPTPIADDPYFKDYTLKISCPIFVARQDFKHMVGRVFNEVSRRYVSDAPDIYWPEQWREMAENVKQGSKKETCSWMYETVEFVVDEFGSKETTVSANDHVHEHLNTSVDLYNSMIENKVCSEQTRMILPQAMITEYYVTADLAAWNRFLNQRLDEHAQEEIRDLAKLVGDALTVAMNADNYDLFD